MKTSNLIDFPTREKSALYLIGGGLESAASAGMLAAIETTSSVNQYDMIVGASAGSFIGAYLLTGRARTGATGYWKVLPEFIKEKKYFNPFGPLVGRPFLDMNTVIRELLSQRNPVCWESTVNHPMNKSGDFYIQMFCAQTGTVHYFHKFKTTRALLAAITGSCWIPLLAGVRPYRIEKELLAEMTLLNEVGHKVNYESFEVFDGHIVDPYFENARNLFKNFNPTLLDPVHPDKYDTMHFALGQNLRWAEQATAKLFFSYYPKALDRYVEMMLNGELTHQAHRCLGQSRSNQSSVNLIYPDRVVEIAARREVRIEVLREKVISGWNGFFLSINEDPLDVPDEWVA